MELWHTVIAGNQIADYAAALGILAVAVVAAKVANHLLSRHFLRLAALSDTELDDLIVRRVLPPGVYLLLIGGAWIAKSRLDLTPKLSLWLDKALLILALLTVFLVMVRLINCLLDVGAANYAEQAPAEDDQERERNRRTAERVKRQLREISNMLVWLLAILTVLSNLGVDLKAIWASLGIGGIALVVAVKEPLANLVGRFYIYGTGIFDEGHFIVFDRWAGTVTKIGMFRTYLELFSDMTTASIPNAQFVTGAVKSYYGRQKFMYKWDLAVPYATPAEQVEGLVQALRDHILARPEVNPQMCWIYLERLGAHSKVVRVWFQVALADWVTSLFYGDQVLKELQQVFTAQGIEFAFPTQTLHVEAKRLLGDGEVSASLQT